MSRYDRQIILPEIGVAGQARLLGAQVLVVGAGGLGATLMPALAGAGVGRLRIVDPDRVDESNLHRQTLYRMDDIGRPKVVCAARELARLNPEIEVEARVDRLDPESADSLLDGVNLVVDAADRFTVTYTLSDACQIRRRPLISASVLGYTGYVGGFCGGGPSYRALFPDLPGQAASCATAGVMGPAVAALGAIQAQMALAVLLGQEPSPIGQFVQLDLAQWRFSSFRFENATPSESREIPFISPAMVRGDDTVVELRGALEAPRPIVAHAVRLTLDEIDSWTPPAGRIVLCCRSGIRAWRAARGLERRGQSNLVVLAVDD